MARNKKAKLSASGLSKDGFLSFVRRVKSLQQDVADSAMAHAGEWNKAEPQGIHKDAAKVCIRLDKMDALKRGDWLRSFDQMREWFDWAAQQDIVDQAEAQLAADIGEAEETERADDPDDLDETDAEEREPVIREPNDPEPVVEADGLDEEEVAAANEELALGGHAFAAGKQAALDGADADGNPHPHDSALHPIWTRGHAQGLRDKEIAETVPGEIVPAPKRGRRKAEDPAPQGSDVEEPVSVH